MNSNAMLSPGVRLVWFEARPDVKIATFRGSKFEILPVPTDYCILIADLKTEELATPAGVKSAVEAATYALLDLYRYFHIFKLRLDRFDDAELVKFRNWSFSRITHNSRSRNYRTAQRSVNVKLRNIYHFIEWCQRMKILSGSTIGPSDCKITSTLSLRLDSVSEYELSEKMKYPKLFRRTGEHSRTGKPQHWATSHEIELIERDFHGHQGPVVAARNTLILRIGEEMGWRRGSILSLTTDQFDDGILQQNEDLDAIGFDIVPSTQKFGYTKGFSMPWALAYSIKAYIDHDRGQIIKRCGASEAVSRHRIFLNTQTGEPLSVKGLSNIFGTAFRAVGAPRGTATHALRRYSGDRTAKEEIDFRRRYGLSTAREDIIEAVAAKLGQSNASSTRYYIKATADLKRDSMLEAHADELSRAYATIAELRAQVAKLEAEKT